MKISKIFAGFSALMIAGAMTAAASAEEAVLYTPQHSWNGTSSLDQSEQIVKFMPEDSDPVKGAGDLENVTTGEKYNGWWAQYLLTSDDVSSVNITFTIVSDGDTEWEYHTFDETKPDEEKAYQVFSTLTGEFHTCDWDTAVGDVDEDTPDMTFVHGYENTWEFTYGANEINDAIANDRCQLNANEDGTYTLGFNIQVGHLKNAKLTGKISADNLYTGAAADGGESSAAANESSAAAGSESSSQAGSSDSSKASGGGNNNTGNNNKSNSSAAGGSGSTSTAASNTEAGGSDNTDNTATGATAGIALAGLAVAGAVAVVAKRKD